MSHPNCEISLRCNIIKGPSGRQDAHHEAEERVAKAPDGEGDGWRWGEREGKGGSMGSCFRERKKCVCVCV